MTRDRVRILFLCTGNSCRSQMAEGLTRHLRSDVIEAFSAGTRPKGVDPRAVRVMSELGIDITGHRSKALSDIDLDDIDYVVTVCGDAHDSCPVVAGGPVVRHHGFEDPPRLAAECASDEEAMIPYRRVRNEIRSFVESLPEALVAD